MNARHWFFSGIAVCMQMPVFVYAQEGGLVPCGREGQGDCQTCHVVQLVSGVNAWLVGILAIVATIMFVIAGFRLVTSNGNPSVLQDAKDMIINVTIGFVIVLAAWLLLDLLMKSLLSDSDQGLGPWNEIACVDQPEARTDPGELDITIIDVATLEETVGFVDPSLAPDVYAEGDCSPENLQSLGMDATQAQVFSCLAQPESGCNLNADNPNSTARGVFQILRGYNNPCHNLNLPACTAAAQAAGWSGSGNLNCSTAFSGGQAIPGNALAGICDAAASNMACNTAAALCLYDDAGGYAPWLNLTNIGPNTHTAQRACVSRYAN
jgi:hypothetical protein